MYSARLGQQVARACPVCDAPEAGGLPDKALFCHVFPESGDDMQIEYEAKDGKLASQKVLARAQGRRRPPRCNLPDESEDAIKAGLRPAFLAARGVE